MFTLRSPSNTVLPILAVATCTAPSTADAAQPVRGGRYEVRDVTVFVSATGRADVGSSRSVRCVGRAYGRTFTRRTGSYVANIAVRPSGSFAKHVRVSGGTQAASGRFERDGEWVSGRFKASWYRSSDSNRERCTTDGWIGFRAHLKSPPFLPGTWTGTTSQGLPVSLALRRRGGIFGFNDLTRFSLTGRLACANGAAVDRAYDIPLAALGARIDRRGRFNDGQGKTPIAVSNGAASVQIAGTVAMRTGSGTFSVTEQDPNTALLCSTRGTYAVRWQRR